MLVLNAVLNEKAVTLINVYGPNKDDIIFLQKVETFYTENQNENYILGVDFYLVIDRDLDKSGGIKNTHPRCRSKMKELMNKFDFVDVWRLFNQDKRVYTWHSNTRPKIFCRLDYFLLKSHMMNSVIKAEIKNSTKSDHSVVFIDLEINDVKRGPGIFKLNNSSLLDTEYKEKIKNAIKDIKECNNDANPVVLWSIIKGAIRNETIAYSSRKHKIEEKN